MLVNKQASIPFRAGISRFILLLGSTQSLEAQGGIKGFGFDHVPPNKARYLISDTGLRTQEEIHCCHTTHFTNDHASFSNKWIHILDSVWLEGSLTVKFSSGPTVQASVLHRNK